MYQAQYAGSALRDSAIGMHHVTRIIKLHRLIMYFTKPGLAHYCTDCDEVCTFVCIVIVL